MGKTVVIHLNKLQLRCIGGINRGYSPEQVALVPLRRTCLHGLRSGSLLPLELSGHLSKSNYIFRRHSSEA